MGVIIVLGLQWGDEGKGKIIDLLSAQAKHIIRAQGGNNAGHSVIVSQKEYHFHLIPSGILYPHTQCFLGAGTVIDLEGIVSEIRDLENKGINLKKRLFISPYAHIVFTYHKMLDALQEKSRNKAFIGTTGKGIGPCYVDKAARFGLRMGDLLDKKRFEELLKRNVKIKNIEMKKLFESSGVDVPSFIKKQIALSEELKSYVFSFESELNLKENILLEGAQGTLLDLSMGTYPYVTSSHTTAAGVCLGAGIPPTAVKKVLGVVKAYTTRVGEGPFPTEFSEEEAAIFDHQMAREFGTTTGRKRRVGWLDAVLMQFSIKLNGVSELALTKLDVLDSFDELKICVGYQMEGKKIDRLPPDASLFQSLEPIYQTFPGWKCSTQGVTKYKDLPNPAQKYIEAISKICQVDVKIISTGPDRDETIIKEAVWKS